MESRLHACPDVDLPKLVGEIEIKNEFRHLHGEVVVEKIGGDKTGMERNDGNVTCLATLETTTKILNLHLINWQRNGENSVIKSSIACHHVR